MSVLLNTVIAADQLINCWFRLGGEWGQPDETLSARAWRVRETHPAWAKWINRVIFWQANHCEAAWQNEVARAHLPNAYRSVEGVAK
ncbi:MAG: hypothetical protein LBF93_06740 [Zoogloeaceae bacterium]|jgi:hypothetical protein|nr:hypothetical protein [Zoogloeaceae bacterium]